MTFVKRLLWIKILGTGIAAAGPMLFAPESVYLGLGFPEQPTLFFLRLYGLSTVALLMGYYSGVQDVAKGIFPAGILRMGLVSNGGQGLAIVGAGALGVYGDWGLIAQAMMWALGLFVLGIAAGILLAFERERRP